NRNILLPPINGPARVPNPDTFKLKDFFDKDFENWLRMRDQITISTRDNPNFASVEFRLMMAPAIGTKTVALYVPFSASAFEICKSFALHYETLMSAQSTVKISMRMPGDSRQMNTDDMRFNGDVFLYTENALTDDQKAALNALYRKHGVTEVSYRSGEWTIYDRSLLKTEQENNPGPPPKPGNWTVSPHMPIPK
ncbi:MAG: hypothetical protein ABI963_14155, partial [Rhizomicrobium sp.]